MFKDGTYAAWFKTPLGQGTGIVHFKDGAIWGRDSIISYDGSYEVWGKRFTATITTKRHTAGQASLLGVDDAELKLEGVSNGAIATCLATADVAPGVVVEVTLIPSQIPRTAPATDRPPLEFKALPHLSRRSRSR